MTAAQGTAWHVRSGSLSIGHRVCPTHAMSRFLFMRSSGHRGARPQTTPQGIPGSARIRTDHVGGRWRCRRHGRRGHCGRRQPEGVRYSVLHVGGRCGRFGRSWRGYCERRQPEGRNLVLHAGGCCGRLGRSWLTGQITPNGIPGSARVRTDHVGRWRCGRRGRRIHRVQPTDIAKRSPT